MRTMKSHGADYFFQHVRSIFKKDDLSIVNMEGTLTDETAREAKTFAFKAPAEYASILSGSSIEAANLANNHSHDYGEKSYTDTISALEDAGIPMISAEVTMIPQNYVTLTDETAVKNLQRTLDLLEDDDDVQAVYHNWDE